MRIVDSLGTTRAEAQFSRAAVLFIVAVIVLVVALALVSFQHLRTARGPRQRVENRLSETQRHMEALQMAAASLVMAAGQLPAIQFPEARTPAIVVPEHTFHDIGTTREAALEQISAAVRSTIDELEAIQGAYEGLKEVLQKVPNAWPIQDGLGRVSFEFGPAIHPFAKTWYMHRGIDIAARPGLRVEAMADGVVSQVAVDATNYGLQVIVQHLYGFETRYAHLGEAEVSRGDTVRIGDTIGTVGSSGMVTGPALHLEIMIGGEVVDPVAFLVMTNDFERRVKK